jgi:uncharacterized protein (TIGR02598 family)
VFCFFWNPENPAILLILSKKFRCGFCAPTPNVRGFPIYQALSRGFCAPGAKHSTWPIHEALSRGFCAPGAKHSTWPIHEALSRGFSLIEVVLALGVIAFALVGIMGLFPVAMKSAQESQRETRATLIAQQIFSDLRVASGTHRMYVRGPSPTNSSWVVTNFSLATDNNAAFLAYDQAGSGLTNNLTSANPVTDPSAIFLATIAVDTNTGTANLSRVQATIEAPAAAPSANRTKYTFVTLMNY